MADPDFDFAAWNRLNDAGRALDEAEQVALASHPHYAEEVVAYRAHFGASLVGEIAGSVEILRELHAADVPLFALTNWSADLFPVALEQFDFLDLFEDIIVSGEEGVAKPDPEIFEVLEERVAPSRGPRRLHLHRRQPGQRRGRRRDRARRGALHRSPTTCART